MCKGKYVKFLSCSWRPTGNSAQGSKWPPTLDHILYNPEESLILNIVYYKLSSLRFYTPLAYVGVLKSFFKTHLDIVFANTNRGFLQEDPLICVQFCWLGYTKELCLGAWESITLYTWICLCACSFLNFSVYKVSGRNPSDS